MQAVGQQVQQRQERGKQLDVGLELRREGEGGRDARRVGAVGEIQSGDFEVKRG